ncbi:MAG TPA: helix-turn-helix domain-containing protein [Mycobacterium sp.]|nr:helix-turn-helix domain-containing protein [Mycobacterium sp.]
MYREWAPRAELRERSLCVWYRRSAESDPVRVVPDGCIDLVWTNGDLQVAGPDTTAWTSRMQAGTEVVGLRFHPGAAPPILGVAAVELVNQRVSVSTLWGRPGATLTARLADATTPAAAMAILQDAVRERSADAPAIDSVVRHFVEIARRQRRVMRMAAFEDLFGLSERQFRRRCMTALGYGPKTLTRILRFQHFLALADRAQQGTLADVAARAGYADQPHLNRDVVQLTGLPPGALVASRRL